MGWRKERENGICGCGECLERKMEFMKEWWEGFRVWRREGYALKAMDNQNPKEGPKHSMRSRRVVQPWIFPFFFPTTTLLKFQTFQKQKGKGYIQKP